MTSAPDAVKLDRQNIETIHPLTPVQASLLFAALRAGREVGTDPGFLQVRCTLSGVLDEAALEAAWDRMVERHAALRTSIHWRDIERPVQIVARRAQVSWTVEDLRGVAREEQERRLERWLEEDRVKGLDLSRPPVLRLARFRRTDAEWSLVMSCHHVLFDGWSGAILLDEATAFHDALRSGVEPQLEAARPFGDYVRWLLRQDPAAGEAYWRDQLGGLGQCATLPFPVVRVPDPRERPPHPGPLPRKRGRGNERADHPVSHSSTATGAPPRPGPLPRKRARGNERAGDVVSGSSTVSRNSYVSVLLDERRTATLQAFVRAERLTAGTLVSAAWAALIAARAGGTDVCFGTTVSGRTAPLPGIESIVGTLINALPLRACVPEDATARAFLHDVQNRLVTMRRFEHTPPERVQAWASVPGRQRTFDSLVVFENFPVRRPSSAGGLSIEDLRGGVTTTAPLTLVAAPGARLELHLLYDGSWIDGEAAGSLLDHLTEILDALVREPDSRIADLIGASRGPGAPSPPATHEPRPATPQSEEVYVDPLELQLIQIFESVLRVHPIGVHEDFFALGGDSLTAARLFDVIEAALGRRLPLATLFEASSVTALAARLRSDGWAAPWSSLVPMQPVGAQPPLFCVHSYEGHVLHYRDLARRLAPDVPVYGLQSIGLNGAVQPRRQVEDMAAHYLAEIRTVQPEGPYRIAGMCFGIAVAFEMAQQLIARGEEVERLFILDSGFLQLLPPPPPDGPFLRRAVDQGVDLCYRGVQLLRRLGESRHARNLRRVRRSNERAWWRYEPKPYPGSITLLRSEGHGSHRKWHIRTWSKLAGQLETHTVPGGHLSFLSEPLVEHLAERVRACLGPTVPV